MPNIWQYRSVLHQKSMTLTDAQIKALPTTKIVLIPSLGDNSNKVIVPLISGSVVAFNCVANYVNSTASSKIKLSIDVWDTTLAWEFAPQIGLDNFLTYGNGKFALWQVIESQVSLTSTEGQFKAEFSSPLYLEISGNSGNLTGGHANNTLTITIGYYIYDVGLKEFVV